MNPNPLSVFRLIVPVVDAMRDYLSVPFVLELDSDEYHTFRCGDPAHQRESGGRRRRAPARPVTRLPQRACYFDGRFLSPARFRSVGDMSIGPGRGCSLAMCVERRFVEICWPQNLQRALPGEM